jgi:hypothetical protein
MEEFGREPPAGVLRGVAECRSICLKLTAPMLVRQADSEEPSGIFARNAGPARSLRQAR